MENRIWSAVDDYFVEKLISPDQSRDAAIRRSDEAGLPAIQVAPNQGRMLEILARMNGTKRILEIGTLGGYSTLWLAKALPARGRLVTLELDPVHAAVAKENIETAGFGDRVEVVQGPAVESLERMIQAGADPFDFIFIDADKGSYPAYLQRSLALAKVGSVIVGDNVVRSGGVLDESSSDSSVQGARSFMAMIAEEPRLLATAIQTVGSKGYDGFMLALVVA